MGYWSKSALFLAAILAGGYAVTYAALRWLP